MAILGWGVGFYGPPIFMHTVGQKTGWSITILSGAVSLHFLIGAIAIANLPRLHARFGVGPCAVGGAVLLALGVCGWSMANTPGELLASAALSGSGWVAMGAVAVNAAIAPWYSRRRPWALAKAYNGASIGGAIFSPIWVWLIDRWGFPSAAIGIGALIIAAMVVIATRVYSLTPALLGQLPDGDEEVAAGPGRPAVLPSPPRAAKAPTKGQYLSLGLGMAIGLFAQIGLLAHLFSLLVPRLGEQESGWALATVTGTAIAGRFIAARLMESATTARELASAGYAVQVIACLILLGSQGQEFLVWVAAVLFGIGVGNATSLPPLIVHAEFPQAQASSVIARIVSVSQATYSFAPAALGLVLDGVLSPRMGLAGSTASFYITVAMLQAAAAVCFFVGRPRLADKSEPT